jgi:uncharacterized membrane protein
MSKQRIRQHLVTVFVSGIVALLPIVGLAATVFYFENQVAGVWLRNQGFYFFGLGLLIVTVLIYFVGLVVSTFVGRWLWRRADLLLDRLPVLGNLYLTFKQILGYGDGPQGLFQRVVLVCIDSPNHYEIGLVTHEPCEQTAGRLAVFVPAAPTPTSGRLVYAHPDQVQSTNLSASQAMQLLVSLGTIQPQALGIPARR